MSTFAEVKKAYYQKGYRDYTRLNNLVRQEYGVNIPQFGLDTHGMEKISKPLLEDLYLSFESHFNSPICEQAELELYKWKDITDFIDFAEQFCIKEMRALKSGSSRIEPTRYFVTK